MKQDHRKIQVVKPAKFSFIHAFRKNQQPVRVVFTQGVAASPVNIGSGMDEQAITGSANSGFDSPQHGGEECPADLRQQQTDGVRPAVGQRPCSRAWDVIQFLDRIPDPVSSFRVDRRTGIDHPADRGNGNLSPLGDISDCGGTVVLRCQM